jgi:hypothetical protein
VRAAGELGHSVPLLDPATDPIRAGAGEVGAARSCARRQRAQASQVVTVDQLAVGEGQHDRQNRFGARDAIGLDRVQERFEVEARQDDGGGPARSARLSETWKPKM